MAHPEGTPDLAGTDWHTTTIDEVMSRLASQPAGLAFQDAQARILEIGPNQLTIERSPSAVRRLLRQFNNVLLYVLVGAAVVTAALGHLLDSGVIIAVVVINALVGYVQEGRAERALQAIRTLLNPVAWVLRDGGAVEIPAVELVPGDVVLSLIHI